MSDIRSNDPEAQRLLQAAAMGQVCILKQVSPLSLKTAVCTSGCTLLHWAAGRNQVETLKYLVYEIGIHVDVSAVKKSQGRTPLHYACRNGCLEAARWLVESGHADPNARAKHGVTPLQLAVWQNQLPICCWLVEQCHVDPAQKNDFSCSAVHWLGICPKIEEDLVPLAEWLAQQPGVTFQCRQKQGHTPLHKAAWGGHLALIQYLHRRQGLWDDTRDHAGNYAADLADMANTPRHSVIAQYLRNTCSRSREESCKILGVDTTATTTEIRKAYLERAREVHPDAGNRSGSPNTEIEFGQLHDAYRHLVDHGGQGNQFNPAHSLKLMLELSIRDDEKQVSDEKNSCFKAQLIAVLLEYGNKGLNLSNVKRKWRQVWPQSPFPPYKGNLSDFIMSQAHDVVMIVKDDSNGSLRLMSKHISRECIHKATYTGLTTVGAS